MAGVQTLQGKTSLDEKGSRIHTEQTEDIDTLPDPDQGKTEEEKRAIVSCCLGVSINQS